MAELLSRLNGEDLLAMVVVGGGLTVGLVIGVTSLLTHAWQKVRRRQMATSLILEMLDRGMSADEIARVLQAGGMDKDDDWIPAIKRLRDGIAGRAE